MAVKINRENITICINPLLKSTAFKEQLVFFIGVFTFKPLLGEGELL
jgi:hypothetical protein